jgi:hypothetical protein
MPSNTGVESKDNFEKRIYETTLAKQKQEREVIRNGSITFGENGELKLDKITSTKAKEEELKNLENANKAARTNLGMSLAGGTLFMGGTIINNS